MILNVKRDDYFAGMLEMKKLILQAIHATAENVKREDPLKCIALCSLAQTLHESLRVRDIKRRMLESSPQYRRKQFKVIKGGVE